MKQLAQAYNDEVEWLLWLFYGMGQAIIFLPCDLYLLVFFLA